MIIRLGQCHQKVPDSDLVFSFSMHLKQTLTEKQGKLSEMQDEPHFMHLSTELEVLVVEGRLEAF